MTQKGDSDTRRFIIEASMKLFARRGYHGTSISQIAEATGLTKGALYWYFKGKEDLFLSVLDRIREDWRNCVMSTMEASEGVAAKLELLFDATAEMVASSESPCSMHLFLVSAGAQPEMKEFEDAIRLAYDGYVETLAGALRNGQEGGEIKKDADPQAAAVGIIGCLEGVVLQARFHPPATIAAAIAELKHNFIRALCVPQRRPTRKEKPLPASPAAADQLNLL